MHLHSLTSFTNLLLPPLHLRPQFRQQLPNGAVRARKKENVWSVDNDLAEQKAERKSRGRRRRTERGKGRGGGKGRRVGKRKLDPDSRILVSSSMLMEVETVLQTQEPVIIPSWSTFTSSLTGLWKGVGAVFSPFTAELEAVSVNSQRENLYDCYTLSRIEKAAEDQVKRRVNWAALNAVGEAGGFGVEGDGAALRGFEEFEWEKSEVLEEEVMDRDPGLVYFEDGSYSRGPVQIPVGEYDERKYFLAPTFKFEQCLVKGCHKRLRIVHTIEFSEGGANIQVIRVAVYEEQWVGPTSLDFPDEGNFEIKPLSQRKRAHPSDLTGSWKVFEISATPLFPSSQMTDSPFVYICTETLKRRSLPDSSLFGEEELNDGEDVSMMWLPGGATGFVEVKEDGVLCVGAGWYGEEGVNLVMERDYGMDGKLIEARWKSEVKRRWNESEVESV
ncbi:hypothetical protein LUZ60_016840 [Juncus effusus]|nr:hypothetical protein LUZ60_016840 [Juncus effusus]